MLLGAIVFSFVCICLYLILRLSYQRGLLVAKIEEKESIREIEEKRDEIASRPSDDADKLLERMRSPHSNY